MKANASTSDLFLDEFAFRSLTLIPFRTNRQQTRANTFDSSSDVFGFPFFLASPVWKTDWLYPKEWTVLVVAIDSDAQRHANLRQLHLMGHLLKFGSAFRTGMQFPEAELYWWRVHIGEEFAD